MKVNKKVDKKAKKAGTKRQAQDNRLGRALKKCRICGSLKAEHYCKGAKPAELHMMKKKVLQLIKDRVKVTARQFWNAQGRPQWQEKYNTTGPPKKFQAKIWTGQAWKFQTIKFKAVTTFVPTKWG